MKMRVNVILSAEKPARTPAQDRANVQRTNQLHQLLHAYGITFVPALGCYKGVEERSVVTYIDNSDDYELVLDMAWNYQQESVLVVDRNHVARLVFAKGGIKRVGMMERVSEIVARSREGWTRTRASDAPDAGFTWWTVNHEATPRVEAYSEGDNAALDALPSLH